MPNQVRMRGVICSSVLWLFAAFPAHAVADSAALPMNQLSAMLTNKIVESWVFDNSGKEIVYTVEHTPKAKDEEFIVKGPWFKRS